MKDVRVRFRSLILIIIGIISTILVMRILLEIITNNRTNILINFIFSLSDVLIFPFENTLDLPNNSFFQTFNGDAIIALVAYVFIGIAISEVVTAFLYDKFEDIIQNLLDGIFKVIEFLLFFRIVLDLFNLFDRRTAPFFIQSIFNLTDWAEGIPFRIDLLQGFLNVSVVIVLIIVVIIDIFTERFMASVFESIGRSFERVPRVKLSMPKLPQRAARAPEAPKAQPKQQIIVNLPPPPPQMAQQPIYIPVPQQFPPQQQPPRPTPSNVVRPQEPTRTISG